MLDSCRALEAEGFDVSYLPVQTNGILDLQVSHCENGKTESYSNCRHDDFYF